MPKLITRFAPSPTGFLHLGHAASAARTFGFAKDAGGFCLLRIEDIDFTRCKPEFEQGIYADLKWLGFKWPEPVRRQSAHMSDYEGVLQTLQNQNLIYRCFKTRKDIMEDILGAPHTGEGGHIYKGPVEPLSQIEEQAMLDSGRPFAWRLSLKACETMLGDTYGSLSFVDNGKKVMARPELLGDVILARKDVGTSYHLSCCHDDALQSVTDIVRGEDLFEATHIHRLLQELLGWPVPTYHHHRLLLDETGKRFAKRDKSLTLKSLREAGETPENILARAAGLG